MATSAWFCIVTSLYITFTLWMYYGNSIQAFKQTMLSFQSALSIQLPDPHPDNLKHPYAVPMLLGSNLSKIKDITDRPIVRYHTLYHYLFFPGQNISLKNILTCFIFNLLH